MALFKRNPNESAYVGGQKHFVDVIKNTGPGNLLIWKQKEEDFNTNSTLIVMPGEEAIFVNGGQIEQVFSNGTYKLNTNNYPFISRLRNSISGGISTFNCVVYFVRTAASMEIYWGTSSPIQVRDPIFNIVCDVRARGSYKINISDSAKFLTKIIGNKVAFQTQTQLTDFFRSEFMMHIKSKLAEAIKTSGEELIGINSRQAEIAVGVAKIISCIFDDYGIALQAFSIESIDIVDNENRQKLEDAISSKGVFGILGDNWDKQKQYELMKDVANNPSSGGIAGMGAGLGFGFSMGGAFGNMAGNTFNNSGFTSGQQETDPLNKVNRQSPQTTTETSDSDPMKSMSVLKNMLDNGFITKEQYDVKVTEILSKL
jgi:membrane protease subunit (stomatin/prohibitin family)